MSDRRKNLPKPIGKQRWEVALGLGTAGKTSNPVSGKYSVMLVFFWALTDLKTKQSHVKAYLTL